VVSNIISIIVQYKITGWGGLLPAEAGKQAGKDKKYIKHISKVEEKPTDYADVGADIGTDVGADIEEGKTGTPRPRYQPSLRAIKRHSKKGKRHKGK
jgi:hypothetical protein